MAKSVAIVLAAGQGKRMESKLRKQYLLLCGKPVLYYCLKTLEESMVDETVLVCAAGEAPYCQSEIVDNYGFTKVKRIVEGGKERHHSVFAGLNAAKECFGGIEQEGIVLIHDGARPFLTEDIIQRAIEGAGKYQACIAGMPAKDTVQIADRAGFIKETPERKYVWLAQTPQAFSFGLAHKAYKRLMEEEALLASSGVAITDDAMAVEYFTGHKAKLIQGSYANIKITTPEDMLIAEALLKNH